MKTSVRKRKFSPSTLTACCALAFGGLMAGSAWAASADRIEDGVVFQPKSNLRLASQAGKRVHTFLQVVKPKITAVNHRNAPAGLVARGAHPDSYGGSPPYSGYAIETPGSLECIYEFTKTYDGCDPNITTKIATGGSHIVVIVDAYDYVDALSDLTTFSAQFGLPAPTSSNFAVVYATGTQPASSSGTGWDLEASLDIEYAHAMAPNAILVLMEAASSSFTDMFYAVEVAAEYAEIFGDGQVSMSWGAGEFSGETSWDADLEGWTNATFYAASGDSWGTIYPCASPYVTCVGGVTHSRNSSTLYLERQESWAFAGAGTSSQEAKPSFQSAISGSGRLVPDVSAIADPNNGVWVYNCTYYGACYWFQVGGTSAATPITAGLDNNAGRFAANNTSYLTTLYKTKPLGSGFGDIKYGYCGVYYGLVAVLGWDNCTGWGSPRK